MWYNHWGQVTLMYAVYGKYVEVPDGITDLTGVFDTIDKGEGDVKSALLQRAAFSNSVEPRVWRPKLFASHR